MARYMADRGIAFFRQSTEESERDVREAKDGSKINESYHFSSSGA